MEGSTQQTQTTTTATATSCQLRKVDLGSPQQQHQQQSQQYKQQQQLVHNNNHTTTTTDNNNKEQKRMVTVLGAHFQKQLQQQQQKQQQQQPKPQGKEDVVVVVSPEMHPNHHDLISISKKEEGKKLNDLLLYGYEPATTNTALTTATVLTDLTAATHESSNDVGVVAATAVAVCHPRTSRRRQRRCSNGTNLNNHLVNNNNNTVEKNVGTEEGEISKTSPRRRFLSVLTQQVQHSLRSLRKKTDSSESITSNSLAGGTAAGGGASISLSSLSPQRRSPLQSDRHLNKKNNNSSKYAYRRYSTPDAPRSCAETATEASTNSQHLHHHTDVTSLEEEKEEEVEGEGKSTLPKTKKMEEQQKKEKKKGNGPKEEEDDKKATGTRTSLNQTLAEQQPQQLSKKECLERNHIIKKENVSSPPAPLISLLELPPPLVGPGDDDDNVSAASPSPPPSPEVIKSARSDAQPLTKADRASLRCPSQRRLSRSDSRRNSLCDSPSFLEVQEPPPHTRKGRTLSMSHVSNSSSNHNNNCQSSNVSTRKSHPCGGKRELDAGTWHVPNSMAINNNNNNTRRKSHQDGSFDSPRASPPSRPRRMSMGAYPTTMLTTTMSPLSSPRRVPSPYASPRQAAAPKNNNNNDNQCRPRRMSMGAYPTTMLTTRTSPLSSPRRVPSPCSSPRQSAAPKNNTTRCRPRRMSMDSVVTSSSHHYQTSNERFAAESVLPQQSASCHAASKCPRRCSSPPRSSAAPPPPPPPNNPLTSSPPQKPKRCASGDLLEPMETSPHDEDSILASPRTSPTSRPKARVGGSNNTSRRRNSMSSGLPLSSSSSEHIPRRSERRNSLSGCGSLHRASGHQKNGSMSRSSHNNNNNGRRRASMSMIKDTQNNAAALSVSAHAKLDVTRRVNRKMNKKKDDVSSHSSSPSSSHHDENSDHDNDDYNGGGDVSGDTGNNNDRRRSTRPRRMSTGTYNKSNVTTTKKVPPASSGPVATKSSRRRSSMQKEGPRENVNESVKDDKALMMANGDCGKEADHPSRAKVLVNAEKTQNQQLVIDTKCQESSAAALWKKSMENDNNYSNDESYPDRPRNVSRKSSADDTMEAAFERMQDNISPLSSRKSDDEKMASMTPVYENNQGRPRRRMSTGNQSIGLWASTPLVEAAETEAAQPNHARHTRRMSTGQPPSSFQMMAAVNRMPFREHARRMSMGGHTSSDSSSAPPKDTVDRWRTNAAQAHLQNPAHCQSDDDDDSSNDNQENVHDRNAYGYEEMDVAPRSQARRMSMERGQGAQNLAGGKGLYGNGLSGGAHTQPPSSMLNNNRRSSLGCYIDSDKNRAMRCPSRRMSVDNGRGMHYGYAYFEKNDGPAPQSRRMSTGSTLTDSCLSDRMTRLQTVLANPSPRSGEEDSVSALTESSSEPPPIQPNAPCRWSTPATCSAMPNNAPLRSRRHSLDFIDSNLRLNYEPYAYNQVLQAYSSMISPNTRVKRRRSLEWAPSLPDRPESISESVSHEYDDDDDDEEQHHGPLLVHYPGGQRRMSLPGSWQMCNTMPHQKIYDRQLKRRNSLELPPAKPVRGGSIIEGV